ncbi:Small hydrophobic protein [Campylobacter jejuni subsp. jejuni D42a]|nr:Small hydrophobic protein [Campylobacter jejuni subsp. jejuni D42a]
MELDQILLYAFIFLNLFALFGLFLGNKKKNQFNDKKFYKICPCKKMAENGSLSTICIYSAVGGFFLQRIIYRFCRFW